MAPIGTISELQQRLAGVARPKVAIFRALKLGDMLCAIPALRAIRKGLPEAEITLIGLPWARDFAVRFSAFVDDFLEFPGFPGLPEREPDLARLPRFLEEVQAEQFDLAIQLHGSGIYVNPLVNLFGARSTAGFYLPGDWCPDASLFLPWPTQGLEIRRLLMLTKHLGLPSAGEDLEFPIFEEDRQALRWMEGAATLRPQHYACVHAGASAPERRWPVEGFATVGDRLADLGLQVVLTGSKTEQSLTAAVSSAMRTPPIDLAGRTTLGSAATLLQNAKLLVCNDTGVSHVAAAVGTPSVVISTGNNPERWAPIDTNRHRVLCSANGVSVDQVMEQVESLLHEFPFLHAARPPTTGTLSRPSRDDELALAES